MASNRAPKQWALTKQETITSFEAWRQNLMYCLALDTKFAPFLVAGFTWKKSTEDATRGLKADDETVAEDKRLTAAQKCSFLDLFLGQIANYCPVIARNTITKKATSLESIWQAIRTHYGFQSTGAHFLDLSDIKLEDGERYEDLFQRLSAFFEDNLLTKDGGISHLDEKLTSDEELSPTVENTIVFLWLNLIHKDLPKLVKQKYGTELRSRTLASIKPEISQALTSLIEEIHTSGEVKAMRTLTHSKPLRNKQETFRKTSRPAHKHKSCPLCKTSNRPDGHFLSECKFLPEQDRKFMTRARLIADVLDNDETSDNSDLEDTSSIPETFHTPNDTSIRRVLVRQSPYIDTYFGYKVPRIVIDSGATANLISRAAADWLGVKITSSSQSAGQADGLSKLQVVGETKFSVTRDDHRLLFHALVVEHLDVPLLAGTPFMELNDVYARPAKREVRIGDSIYPYGSASNDPPTARRASILRAPQSTTIWPGEYVEIPVPNDTPDGQFALEPRIDSPTNREAPPLWPSPSVVSSVSHTIRIVNNDTHPKTLNRHDHFCQILPVFDPLRTTPPEGDLPPPPKAHTRSITTPRHSLVSVDPDNILAPSVQKDFTALLHQFTDVFESDIGCYNGAYGPYQAVVNMGPVLPPQRKGRLPLYNQSRLQELQSKFDELERAGVLIKPESADITVEYVNPSFLINKPNGGSRLVTAFGEVGQYSKPTPSLMPDVESTLRQISRWSYIIATDLTSAFYQIPLSKASLKYCGVVTPYRGIRTYARCAMGMPGSETALEELMCRVLGDLLQEGIVAKLADDLYCGADTPEQLLINWTKLLTCIQKAGLKLSPTKTIVSPKSTTVLGWIWQQGTLHASPHRIATLANCDPPKTVKGLRSFIGAFKALSKVIPSGARTLAPLDAIVAGAQSADHITWSDENLAHFKNCQKCLLSHKTITLPRASDQLWIVTDGAVRDPGVGATMYVVRQSKLYVSGFFSAKLRHNQITWLPCEVEALAIASAIKHFSPYIIQSNQPAQVLTDSKPCVQAYERLLRGEFSASPRITTFLSTVARYHVAIRHLAGSSNVPSDFASRNAPPCVVPQCQVCSFLKVSDSVTVLRISPQDILAGTIKAPFTTRSTWLSIQSECRDLRRTCAHLRQGTRPSRKATDIKDVKRYLQVATVAHDGLLVVKRNDPLTIARECIIVPRQVLHGLVTSMHIKLSHPSRHQLKSVLQRYFYALDMTTTIDDVTNGCHQCATVDRPPPVVMEQSTSDPPEAVGVSFATDILKQKCQLVLLVRETVTSYTLTMLIPDEKQDTIRNALLQLCVGLIPVEGPPAVIRADGAPSFQSLAKDQKLASHNILIEIGRLKNPNKNPVAERAIQELEDELRRLLNRSDKISPTTLAIATAHLNSRVRSNGMSSREILLQRDQFTNNQLPIHDKSVIESQYERRTNNHEPSMTSKRGTQQTLPPPNICPGDIVYLPQEKNKIYPRDRYLVTSTDPPDWCNIRKFVGHQLRNTSYRVKRSQVHKVRPFSYPNPDPSCLESEEDQYADTEDPPIVPTQVPNMPQTGPTPEYRSPDISPPTIPPLLHSPVNTDTDSMSHVPEVSVPPPTVPLPVHCTPPVVTVQTPACPRPSRQRRQPRHLDDYVLD